MTELQQNLSADAGNGQGGRGRYRQISLFAGPLCALLMLAMPVPETLGQVGWATAAIGIWMAIWWSTEAVPVPVTALLPLVCFAPLGILDIKAAAAPYANPTIYLFLGGFVLASAMQKCGLHRRIAYFILSFVSAGARSIILGFMLVSAILSMWMTNTSTTMMLLPIGLSIISSLELDDQNVSARTRRNFQLSLLLGIAYAATIGGMTTLVGTPPNAFLAGFMSETYGMEIGFAQWMLVGVPLAVVLLPLTWWSLTRWIYPVDFSTPAQAREKLVRQRTALGKTSKAEWRVGLIFSLVALGWMTRPLLEQWLQLEGLSDAGIAMLATLALFVVPAGNDQQTALMDWEDMRDIPWGILLLFGGGLSLAAAVSGSGLAQWLGQSLVHLNAFGILVLVLSATAMVIFLTEMTSNLATAATFLPVVAAIALEIGGAPISLTVPVALAASCAFMLPVATPPNAIVFSSGYISIPQMARAGLVLNLLCIGLVTFVSLWLAPMIFGR
ncbi:SLC13 family permease [Bowmanella dokdonensis]|uniref:DASS family sodium-coupled anion symporter n=1 Tax=Bowmanella dokdonensis TaxID=751969 RepID=A0A939DNI0_9ALTE|nr:DASS family sodium-coupled anion symporter [Bowmanella dokdonensis]MBN7825462.1 DASS family sodium-coupled anion symporter [Bowmanella dokdonensis]